MNSEPQHSTLVDTVINLQERGYHYDFIADNADIICLQGTTKIKKGDFDIIETYYFHRQGKRKNIVNLLAIQLHDSDIRGILMNAGGLDGPMN